MALAVQCSFISYMVCAAFDHMAYQPLMPLMCGIAVVISRTAPEELARLLHEMIIMLVLEQQLIVQMFADEKIHRREL